MPFPTRDIFALDLRASRTLANLIAITDNILSICRHLSCRNRFQQQAFPRNPMQYKQDAVQLQLGHLLWSDRLSASTRQSAAAVRNIPTTWAALIYSNACTHPAGV